MQIAHKIELRPNNKAITYFRKACGISRFCWNWGLAKWDEQYIANQKLPPDSLDRKNISGMSLKKEFNAIKKQEYPWVMDVTKYAAQQPFIQLNTAFKRFFLRIGNRPKFKKKNRSVDSFYIGGDQVKVDKDNNKIWIPNLGFVKMKERLRFDGKINSATISRIADRWFVSIQVNIDKDKVIKCKSKKTVGADLGINSMVTLSDGISIQSPKPLRRKLRKLKRHQRVMAKKIRAAKRDGRKLSDSKNFGKQKNKVAKLHYQVANIRKDTLHKITTYLTNNFLQIAIEDLNVKGMLKNHKLARAISDIGFGEFRRQLEYKSNIRENNLIIADRFFPSSKTCSKCKSVKSKDELTLKDRTYKCKCGHEQDRDLNAAINLENVIYLKQKVRPVRSKLTPVEITAMREVVFPLQVTSIVESGNKLQTG